MTGTFFACLRSILTERAYSRVLTADTWEEIWEAGPYYDRIADLLEKVEHYAIFVGWQIDSRLQLKRRKEGGVQSGEAFRDKVIRLCDANPHLQIYFLLWDHSYFFVPEREFWQGRIWDKIHPRVHFIFDNKHTFGASHHEKICIIDGVIALCGGIDICDERWDDPRHLYDDPRRSLDGSQESHGPYHDLAIQVTGSICVAIQEHIASRWKAVSSIPFPIAPNAPEPRLGAEAYRVFLSRTLAYLTPKAGAFPLVREVEFLFRDLIRSAESRIVLEGQYFWSKEINDMLISKMLMMRGKPFEVALILSDLRFTKSPSKRMMNYELRLLSRLRDAANYSGTYLLVGSPLALPPHSGVLKPPKPVYIHSKVIIIDDRYLGIGSTNCATRALRLDTELHLTLEALNPGQRQHIKQFTSKLFKHWNIQHSQQTKQNLEVLNNDPVSTNIYFRSLHPHLELQWIGKLKSAAGVPWEVLFDPRVPWFFGVKSSLLRLGRKHPLALYFALFLLWVGTLLSFPFYLSSFPSGSFLYFALLSSVWVFPISFSSLNLIFLLHFGGIIGLDSIAHISVAALWVASVFGYFWARIFPSQAAEYFFACERDFRWAGKKIGLRSFEELLEVLLHPFVSLRAKIFYQGLYFIPFPWFLLSTCLILASVVHTAVRWGGALLFYVIGYGK